MQKEHSSDSTFSTLERILLTKIFMLSILLWKTFNFVSTATTRGNRYIETWYVETSFIVQHRTLAVCSSQKFVFDKVLYSLTFWGSISCFLTLDDDQKYKDWIHFPYYSNYDLSIVLVKHLLIECNDFSRIIQFSVKIIFRFSAIPWFSLAIVMKNLTNKIDIFIRKTRKKNFFIVNFNIRLKP